MNTIRLIQPSAFTTSKWSGGSTTEMILSPEGSNYKSLDFDYRISTAVVESETSIYTPLKGIQRTLMVLEGTLQLQHEEQHSSSLTPYKKDTFSGDWTTHSQGKVTNFNLMTSAEVKGDIIHFSIAPNSIVTSLPQGRHHYLFLHKGELNISVNGKEYILKANSILSIENVSSDLSFQFNTTLPAELIWVVIE